MKGFAEQPPVLNYTINFIVNVINKTSRIKYKICPEWVLILIFAQLILYVIILAVSLRDWELASYFTKREEVFLCQAQGHPFTDIIW